MPASNTVIKIIALSLVSVAKIEPRARESSLSESLRTDIELLNGRASRGHAPSRNVAVKQNSRVIATSLGSPGKKENSVNIEFFLLS